LGHIIFFCVRAEVGKEEVTTDGPVGKNLTDILDAGLLFPVSCVADPSSYSLILYCFLSGDQWGQPVSGVQQVSNGYFTGKCRHRIFFHFHRNFYWTLLV